MNQTRPRSINLFGALAVGVGATGLGSLAATITGLIDPTERLYALLTHLLGTPRAFQLLHSIFGLGAEGKTFAFYSSMAAWVVFLTLLAWRAGPLAAGVVTVIAAWLLAGWSLPGLLAGVISGLLVAGLWALLARPASAGRLETARSGSGQPGADRPAVGLLARGEPRDPSRRRAVGVIAAGAGALAAGTLLRASHSDIETVLPPDGGDALAAGAALPDGVTAQRDLYYVSKNLEAFDPVISSSDWKLKVSGLVNTPRDYTLASLKRLPSVTSERTLSCISNPVGGPLIGNVVVTGLRVRDLLHDVGVNPKARWVTWRAADDYAESLPLADALEEDVLLVHSINGESLTRRHGFPLRVSIPNRYGMKQPRWLTSITLDDHEVTGYWAGQGWSRTALVKPASRIVTPGDGAHVAAGSVTLRGDAFAGTTPITAVQLSLDNGHSWQDATLIKPRSKYTWTRWKATVRLAAGNVSVIVRCRAGNALQDVTPTQALPEAATGLHRVTYSVS